MFDQKTDGSLCIKNVEDCGMCGMCHVMSERERERVCVKLIHDLFYEKLLPIF